jgi:HAD superfamily hydrolase (TIGR01549 family)
MTEEFDAIMLDLGGTMVDLSPPREVVLTGLLSKHGLETPVERTARVLAKADGKFDEDFAKLDGKEETTFWSKYDMFVLKELGFTGDIAHFSKEAGELFDKIIPKVESWAAYPDTKPILEMMEKKDLVLGVVSNATDLAVRVLDNLGLTKYFDTIVVSQEVGVRKPSPEIFRIAAKRAGVSPSRCLYAGDKFSVDVVGAKRAGMNAVLIDRVGAYPNAKCIRGRDLNIFRRFL